MKEKWLCGCPRIYKPLTLSGKEAISMCYNCGCGMPDSDQGQGHAGVDPDGKAITTKTFEAAAKAFDMKVDEAKKNTHELLMEEGEE